MSNKIKYMRKLFDDDSTNARHVGRSVSEVYTVFLFIELMTFYSALLFIGRYEVGCERNEMLMAGQARLHAISLFAPLLCHSLVYPMISFHTSHDFDVM